MKNTSLIIVLIVLFSIKIFACENEPTLETTGKILKEIKIKKAADSANNSAEIGLFVIASVPGASWQTKEAEAAVLTVFVDGKYNQDAVLFAGEKTFEYQMFLGKYDSKNENRITIVLNKARSAPNARNVKLHAAFTTVFEDLTVTKPSERSIPAYIATINAPVIYLRPDTIDRFSDVPLLTYYEIFDEPEQVKRIRYTTIFTNEDGGTQSAALMARWGRMTDIEWIYEIRVRESGEILSEIYQAANHETHNFQGKRFGSHPLIIDATVNNNFSDAGCSPLRVSPLLVQTNLARRSRETVMDAFSWTYRIMAEEAAREGRVNPANLGANTIADLRDYFYVELETELENAAVAVDIEDQSGAKTSSDAGNPLLRVGRSGFVRIAVIKPPNQSKNGLASVNVRCHAISADKESVCERVNLLKIVELDRNFQPRETKLNNKPQTIKNGETGKFAVTGNSAPR